MRPAGALPILIATLAAAASAEPVVDVLDACDAVTTAEQAQHLLGRDWSDTTAPDSFASVLDESRFIEARGRLASSSHPEPWTDADVVRRWPSTYATTLDALAGKLPLRDLPPAGYRVLSDTATDTRAVLWFNGCYVVGRAEDNPAVVAAAFGRPGVGEGDSVSGELLQGDRWLKVTVLGDHGLAPDPRFPVRHDLTVVYNPMRRLP